MTATVDYDAGSLRSVEKVSLSLGEMPAITRDRKTILKADKAILPGVGSSGGAMEKLEQCSLVDVVCRTVDQGAPFLGVYSGLQLLFTGSEESQGAAGPDILPGKILKMPEHPEPKIPHMGWNSLKTRPEAKLFHGIKDGTYAYFVCSYYLKAKDESVVAASMRHSTVIHASVERGNVFACQFHSERSGEVGLATFRNFIGL